MINPDPLMLQLARRRLEKNLTLWQVALMVGVSRNSIHKWENGVTSPTWIHLQKWLAVMDIEAGFRPAVRVGV